MGFYWCKKFSDFIGELELMDIPLGGGAFTWTGGLRGQSMSRPDYFCMQSLKIKTIIIQNCGGIMSIYLKRKHDCSNNDKWMCLTNKNADPRKKVTKKLLIQQETEKY